MFKSFKWLYLVYVCTLLCFISYHIGLAQRHDKPYYNSTHVLCKDNIKETAWVSYKKGELRCFFEGREYPHRAKSAHIEFDDSTN